MYEMIKNHPSVATIYGKRLADEGSFAQADQERFRGVYIDVLKKELEKARSGAPLDADDAFESGEWKAISREYSFDQVPTGVDKERLDVGPVQA